MITVDRGTPSRALPSSTLPNQATPNLIAENLTSTFAVFKSSDSPIRRGFSDFGAFPATFGLSVTCKNWQFGRQTVQNPREIGDSSASKKRET